MRNGAIDTKRTARLPILLFCANPLNYQEPDPGYQTEWDAAREQGFPCVLLNYEALLEGNMNKALRQIPFDELQVPGRLFYRGWMMKAAPYRILWEALRDRQVIMNNGPDEHLYYSRFPLWYEEGGLPTPESVSVPLRVGETVDFTVLQEKLRCFGDSPVILKDYVKSQKHRWLEACFVPVASDHDAVRRVVTRFLELQGDALEGGLVFRRFMEFEPVGTHPASGMPLTKEFRLFFANGELVQAFPYWAEGDYQGDHPPVKHFQEFACKLPGCLISMDVAKVKDGPWMVVEVGDGQVTGLPDNVDPREFYRDLAQRMAHPAPHS